MSQHHLRPVSRRGERPLRANGFTLAEVGVVVIMVGVLAAVAIPLITPARFRVNSATMEVATEFLAAQRMAVLKGHNIVIAFDEDGGTVRIHEDANNDGAIQTDEATQLTHLPEGAAFGRAGAPAIGSSSQAVTFTQRQGSLRKLTFHRNGSASEEGYVYITGTQGGALAKNTRAIQVIRATARVKCWSYQLGSWRETC